jgi:hypothetical protein
VVGSWNFSVSGESGKATQTIVIQQDGVKITGDSFFVDGERIRAPTGGQTGYLSPT